MITLQFCYFDCRFLSVSLKFLEASGFQFVRLKRVFISLKSSVESKDRKFNRVVLDFDEERILVRVSVGY